MYAVIATGGKQYRVAVGDTLDVERLVAGDDGTVTLAPVMLVDGDEVTVAADALGRAAVSADVVGEVKGKKLVVFTYKNKTGYRRRTGHRQRYTRITVTGISTGADGAKTPETSDAGADGKE